MLRGSAPARVDEKGRLKIPVHFRQAIEGKYGREFFITSFDGGLSVRMYPFPEWLEVEQKLMHAPSMDASVEKFREMVTYYGAMTSMDKQGRVLIQALLRERAKMKEDVAILGQLTYLGIWNRKKLDERITNQTITDEDIRNLSERGF